MTVKTILIFLGKLLLGAFAFGTGLLLGGMIAGITGLQPPTLPPGMDANATLITMLAASPLMVLALYFVGHELAGGWLARTAVLTLFTWIAYTLNNAIEAVFFSSYMTAPCFTLVNFAPAVLFCAAVTAWLFPSLYSDIPFMRAWREYFHQRKPGAWMWRLLVAALVFMPVYYLFGLCVEPLVGDFYRQGDYGLAAPPLRTLLLVLAGRSILFLFACLPVIIAWRGSVRRLWMSLGFALFVLVGLLYMLAGNWLPVPVRIIHSIEILADSFVYAGLLVWLLAIEPQDLDRSSDQNPIVT